MFGVSMCEDVRPSIWALSERLKDEGIRPEQMQKTLGGPWYLENGNFFKEYNYMRRKFRSE